MLNFIQIVYYMKQKYQQSNYMHFKHRTYLSEGYSIADNQQYRNIFPRRGPIKSPSPDRKSANIITPTRSPQLMDIKRQLTPIKDSLSTSKVIQQIELAEQAQFARSRYAEEDDQRGDKTGKYSRQIYSGSRKYEIGYSKESKGESSITKYQTSYGKSGFEEKRSTEGKSPNQWKNQGKNSMEWKNSSDNRGFSEQKSPSESKNQANTNEGKTSNKRNLQILLQQGPDEFSIDERNGQVSELEYIRLLRQKEETIRELHEIISMINRNGVGYSLDEEGEGQLQRKVEEYSSQVKILMIQNQKLISVIENNNVNIASNREEILHREIRELRESLQGRDRQLQQNSNILRKLQRAEDQIRELENQNQSLLRLVKEKDDAQRRSQVRQSSNSVGSSNSLTPKSTVNLQKEKLSLIKIKEQYAQTLKIIKENTSREIQQKISKNQFSFDQLNRRIVQLEERIYDLEDIKQDLESRLQNLKSGKNLTPKTQKGLKDSNLKERHQEIESLMMQKYSRYEAEITSKNKINQGLTEELSKTKRDLQALQEEYNQLKSVLEEERLSTIREKKQNQNQSQNERNKIQMQNYERIARQNAENLYKKALSELNDKKNQQIRKLQQKIQAMNEEKKDIEGLQLVRYNKKLAKMDDEYKQNELRLRLNYQNLQSQFQGYTEQTEDKVRKLVQNYQTELQVLKSSIMNKSTEIGNLNADIQRLQNQNREFQRRIQELTELNKSSRKRLQDKQENEAYYMDIIERNKILDGECNDQKNMLQKANIQRKTLEAQIQKSRQEAKAEKLKSQNLQGLMSQKEVQLLKLRQNLIEKNNLIQERNRLITENQGLKDRIKELESTLTKVNQSFQLERQDFRSELDNFRVNKENQITGLKSKIQRYQINSEQISKQIQILRTFQSKFIKVRGLFQSVNLEQELQQLRKYVEGYYLSSKNRQESQIFEQHQRLLNMYQSKIEENQRIIKQSGEIKEIVVKQQQERLLLKEKIAFLESNIAIYENQLRERKSLYERLAFEKARMEREMLLAKKIKMEQSSHQEDTKISTFEFHRKIDKLLVIERERQQQLKQFAEQNETMKFAPVLTSQRSLIDTLKEEC